MSNPRNLWVRIRGQVHNQFYYMQLYQQGGALHEHVAFLVLIISQSHAVIYYGGTEKTCTYIEYCKEWFHCFMQFSLRGGGFGCSLPNWTKICYFGEKYILFSGKHGFKFRPNGLHPLPYGRKSVCLCFIVRLMCGLVQSDVVDVDIICSSAVNSAKYVSLPWKDQTTEKLKVTVISFITRSNYSLLSHSNSFL